MFYYMLRLHEFNHEVIFSTNASIKKIRRMPHWLHRCVLMEPSQHLPFPFPGSLCRLQGLKGDNLWAEVSYEQLTWL